MPLKRSLSFRFSHQTLACISVHSLAFCICHPAHSPWFYSMAFSVAYKSWRSLLSSFLELPVILRLCGSKVIFRNSGHKAVKCFYITINPLLHFRWLILVLIGSYLLFVSFKRNILVMYYYVRKLNFKWQGICFMKHTSCVHGGFEITRIWCLWPMTMRKSDYKQQSCCLSLPSKRKIKNLISLNIVNRDFNH
jgi:hypothetical protein